MIEHGGQQWFLVNGQWHRGWCREAEARAARRLLRVGAQRGYGSLEAWGPPLGEAVQVEFRGTEEQRKKESV